MAIFDNAFVHIQVQGMQAGEFCYTNLWYYPVTEDTGYGLSDLEQVADDFQAAVIPYWLQLISADHTLLEFTVTRRGNINPHQSVTKSIASAGSILSGSLPVFTTFSFQKFVNELATQPVADRNWRPGRISISGIPETSQENGVITPAALTDANAFANAIVAFANTDDPLAPFNMFMIYTDNVVHANTRVVPVSTVAYNRIGTQLTRKR